MHQIGWKNYLEAAGFKNEQQWKNLALRDKTLVYAFGDVPADVPKGRYFDIDAAIARIGLDLAPGLGQVEAMNILRLSDGPALNAIAWADYTDIPVYFGVAEGEISGNRAFQVASGRFEDFASLLHGVRNSKGEAGPTTRIILVNVTEVLRRVRANAAAKGLDLSDPFLPPPDSKAFAELMSAGRKMDGERLAEIREALVREART